jgi:hypothetical protein
VLVTLYKFANTKSTLLEIEDCLDEYTIDELQQLMQSGDLRDELFDALEPYFLKRFTAVYFSRPQ